MALKQQLTAAQLAFSRQQHGAFLSAAQERVVVTGVSLEALARNGPETILADDDGALLTAVSEAQHMELGLDQAMQELDISQFQAWSEIREHLREPKLFNMDYDLRDFRIAESGEIFGMADIMLTYRGDFLGSLEESITLSAAVSGTVDGNRAVITDVRVSF